MKLTKIEKKQFVKMYNEIVELADLGSVEVFDEFFHEDIEYRVDNIDKLITLLKQEKSMLKDIK